MTVTGERATTAAGGFNPTWQRHVAAYQLCAQFFGPGRVLDLGCGVGHSFEALAPRVTVGVDIAPGALRGQARETHVADMRRLPFEAGAFASVLSVHSLEHVPDPARVLAEVVRVLAAGGTAVFVTPNRLTFARPDEIIDPYHHIEFDVDQLATLCREHFEAVDVRGLFGSPRYLELIAAERRELERLLALDFLRLRRAVPRTLRQRLYDRRLTRARHAPDPRAAAIEAGDFHLGADRLHEALDLIAVCRSAG